MTSFSNIFEKAVFNRSHHHINVKNILPQEQYGFRTKLSSDMATFTSINKMLLILNNKLAVGGIFCYLNKAFDCVKDKFLLVKLEFYGIYNLAGKLIKFYLTDRYQRTLLNSNYTKGASEWQNVKQGVSQGSILGPLIFPIYIYDLPFLINESSKPILYADDTSILCSNTSSTELVTTLKAILLKIN
jgi:hypothetical protein